MRNDNVIQEKSYAFALRVVALYRHLISTGNGYVLTRQLLKSGTSIGANIEEAIGGQSRRDFQAKIAIAYKEARESRYWLRLLRDSAYLTGSQSQSMLDDCNELLKIMGSIQKTPNQPATHNS